jgi:hypothetical protein
LNGLMRRSTIVNLRSSPCECIAAAPRISIGELRRIHSARLSAFDFTRPRCR